MSKGNGKARMGGRSGKSFTITSFSAPKKSAPKIIEQTTTHTFAKSISPQSPSTEESGNGEGVGSGSGAGTGHGPSDGAVDGTGVGSNDHMSAYSQQLFEIINRRKNYPVVARRLRHEGRVVIKVRLNKLGELLHAEILEPSRYENLNKASLDTIYAIKKFPQLPDDVKHEEISLNVPFEYLLTNKSNT